MSTSANDNSSRSAQEVGWIFVREYCNHLSDKPESLYHFYDKQSSLIRGLEGDEVKICQGQQDIKKNIAETQLKDASINIINVDSLEFLDGKVVVQVIGKEISNKGEACKKFVRTVILAKQTDDNDNYYVLSDIFRYLKDENANVIKQQSIDQEPSCIEDGLSTLNEEKSANGEDTVSSTGTLNEEPAQESSRELKVIEDSVSDIPPTKTSAIETPSLAKSSSEDLINQVADENSTESEKSNSSDTRSKIQPSISVQTEKLATTPSNATISPTESRSPSKPSTWANLAASDSQKWSNSQLAESKGRVVQPPLTRSQSQQSNQSNREHRDQKDQRDSQRDSRSGNTTVNKEFSLYIKGIVEGMNRTVLEKAFTKFGTVRNLDVVPSKSCAFVEFVNQEAYHQALSQKQIDVPEFGSVVVEERKPKDHHRHYRNSFNNYHNGSINSQRGGGGRGGRNMTTRPPAKS